MGNSPSVSGPGRGSSHVEGDIRLGGHLTGQRPAYLDGSAFSIGPNSELAEEIELFLEKSP